MIVDKNSGSYDLNLSPDFDLIKAIEGLKNEMNAIVLAHYYQPNEVQDIADYIGDSLGLSQKAADTSADVIVFAGVHFMAETAKILSPSKKVLIPDLEAGCSLADSCNPHDFKNFVSKHPNHKVVTYVNTSAQVKALSDVCCTSSNAVQIVESFPLETPIIFAPDKNLGNYIRSITNRSNMVIWDGACHVHEQFSLERILELKKKYPDAKLIAHPECQKPILIIADFIGSTSELLKFVQTSHHSTFIVATESGILHQMLKSCPAKHFIPAPPNDSTCACNECSFMKLITLEKIYLALKHQRYEIVLPQNLIEKAYIPIEKMLVISRRLGLI